MINNKKIKKDYTFSRLPSEKLCLVISYWILPSHINTYIFTLKISSLSS